jgi:hypothetical protein
MQTMRSAEKGRSPLVQTSDVCLVAIACAPVHMELMCSLGPIMCQTLFGSCFIQLMNNDGADSTHAYHPNGCADYDKFSWAHVALS